MIDFPGKCLAMAPEAEDFFQDLTGHDLVRARLVEVWGPTLYKPIRWAIVPSKNLMQLVWPLQEHTTGEVNPAFSAMIIQDNYAQDWI